MIYLAQTDTTAGFLSKDKSRLNAIKQRPLNTPCLITSAKFSELKSLTRIPNTFKNLVRKAKKTSFIYPNLKAIRIVKDCEHAKFLAQKGFFYSSSANLHGSEFDEAWAKGVADVVVDEYFFEQKASKILKLSRSNIKKIR